MKIGDVRVKGFTAATLAALETAINDWTKASGGGKMFVGLEYEVDTTGAFTALLSYTG
ncbi:MAG: hypothetical protein H0W63_03850 [Gemmatimonadaceae bacterium]|nr:hypothetical protein [Gemmatimonadaceae bacterium]